MAKYSISVNKLFIAARSVFFARLTSTLTFMAEIPVLPDISEYDIWLKYLISTTVLCVSGSPSMARDSLTSISLSITIRSAEYTAGSSKPLSASLSASASPFPDIPAPDPVDADIAEYPGPVCSR